MLQHAKLAVVTAALTLALTACGGSDGEQDSAETETPQTWAGDVCGSAATWAGELAGVTTTLKDTGNLSANSLKDALNQAVTATTTLVDDLQALEAPDTEAGAAAKEDIAALANALSEQRDTFNDTIDQAPSGAAGVLTAAAAAATLLTTMSTSVTSTFASLQSLEGGEELKQAFESADECQDFRSGS